MAFVAGGTMAKAIRCGNDGTLPFELKDGLMVQEQPIHWVTVEPAPIPQFRMNFVTSLDGCRSAVRDSPEWKRFGKYIDSREFCWRKVVYFKVSW